jgi:hypothetical protein
LRHPSRSAEAHEDGTPAGDYTAAVPDWKPGHTIPLGAGRSLRVIEVREGVLVVESLL